MQVKILQENDLQMKLNTRELYEENFDINDKDYIDYYYDVIVKRNKIAILEDNGKIISMIHLNPYKYSVFGKIYDVHYLVAITTKLQYRGNGYMNILLNETLLYLKELNEPFCYLLADNKRLENYYKKYGFEVVCKFTLDKFSNDTYDVFPVNDEEYNDLMIAENDFLEKESDDYRLNLSRKNVMMKILNNMDGLLIDKFKNSKVYICQEV